MSNAKYYLGLMSGTSADGVDLALVDFSMRTPELIAHCYQPYSDDMQNKITQLYLPDNNEIDTVGSLNVELAKHFAVIIQRFLAEQHLSHNDIIAIGNHGQTIRHRPCKNHQITHPFTLQIGCNHTLAYQTNIRVIGDFRSKDIVLGGQGAPLVPAFHQYLFSHRQQDTFIVNLGGIANITYLPQDEQKSVLGFDTGPANALLDSWCALHTTERFDNNGAWAAQGIINQTLLNDLLSDPYFSLPAPKSTGREYFTLDWLTSYLSNHLSLSAVDVQATLTALTCQTIAQEINKLSPKAFVYLCGGGINNNYSYKLLEQELSSHSVKTIHALKLNNNAFEAMAFAWLAFAYDKKIYGNIPAVTGASKETVLGVEFNP